FSITIRLKPAAWWEVLAEAGLLMEYEDVLTGLEQGFKIGIEQFKLSSTFIPSNHFTSDQDATVVHEKFREEILLGRLSPSFDPHVLEELIGHFCT
ncbi:hypothetical protein GYMLUDRAFT_114662, partial [Collybiopsis luxurians FD-317 M1]